MASKPKKTSTPPTPPATKAIRRRKTSPPAKDNHPLTTEEIEHFAQLLLEKRRELIGDVDHMWGESVENNQNESSDLSNMPIHMADIGTDNYEQEFTLGLIESERNLLREIDHALNKIREGTYGVCEGTGQPIGRGRLEAKPEARYCVEYARMIEKGLVRPDLEDDAVAK
ncbi:MAG: TraR/DksA C4-type zinc finger protein [Sedimentisphaerales bacterium]|nr:TraR/DksA C4-type zinc finger protein [Sedimentisphaerales bacterium]